MRDVDDILRALEQGRQSIEGQDLSEDKRQRLLRIHDNAYFLMLFALFESEVSLLAEQVIVSGLKDANPLARRLAKLVGQKAIQNVPFKSRLALLTDSGGADYRIVADFYDDRNAIAHGEDPTRVVKVPTAADRLKTIAARLQGAP